jgi:hypothetical protein
VTSIGPLTGWESASPLQVRDELRKRIDAFRRENAAASFVEQQRVKVAEPPQVKLQEMARALQDVPVLSFAAIGAQRLYAAPSHLVYIIIGYRQYWCWLARFPSGLALSGSDVPQDYFVVKEMLRLHANCIVPELMRHFERLEDVCVLEQDMATGVRDDGRVLKEEKLFKRSVPTNPCFDAVVMQALGPESGRVGCGATQALGPTAYARVGGNDTRDQDEAHRDLRHLKQRHIRRGKTSSSGGSRCEAFRLERP